MATFHPLRIELHQEIHARPYPKIASPTLVSHLAIFADEKDLQLEHKAINELARIFQVNGVASDASSYFEDFGRFRLRWENHREFSTLTLIQPLVEGDFNHLHPLELLPEGWFDKYPGKVISATSIAICAEYDEKKVEQYLGTRPIVASHLIGDQATVWTSLQLDNEGFTRFFLIENHFGQNQLGRIVIKILEIETYRQMALLGLPVAKRIAPEASQMGQQCAAILEQMTSVTNPEQESQLLQKLTRLSAEVERLRAGSSYRFAATRAYAEIVNSRMNQLEQERVQGKAKLGEFLKRRFMPAIRTCQSVEQQLENLSKRLTRASDLLRTRVEHTIAEQNQKLLESMNRRSQLQLRLQQTVEGLSVAAISYYLISLLKLFLHGLNDKRFHFDEGLVLSISVPIVVFVIYWLVRKMRRHLLSTPEDD